MPGVGVGHDAFRIVDQPVEQVDVMVARSAKAPPKFPGAALFGVVATVSSRSWVQHHSRPVAVDGTRKRFCSDRVAEQLQRVVGAGFCRTGQQRCQALSQARPWRVLQRVAAGLGDDRVARPRPPRLAGCSSLGWWRTTQSAAVCSSRPLRPSGSRVPANSGSKATGIDVVDIHRSATAGVRLDGGEVAGNASASRRSA